MFKQHLKKSKVGYTEHFVWALTAAFKLFYAGFASLVHAFIPSLFEGTAAKIVIDLYCSRLENHPNTDYQDYIKSKHD